MASEALRPEQSGATRLPTAAAMSLLLWAFLLAFGGGCLALYYSRIGYFPEIGWEESLTYLAVLSIIGGSLVLAFSLLAFLPGVIWSEWLIWDCSLRTDHKLWYARSDGTLEPCAEKIWWTIGFPFVVFMFPAHFVLGGDRGEVWACAAVFFALALVLFLYKIKQLISDVNFEDPAKPLWRDTFRWLKSALLGVPVAHDSRQAKYMLAFVTSGFVGLASLVAIGDVVGKESSGFGLGLLCTTIVVAANLFVGALYRTRRSSAIVVGIVAAVLLLGAGEILEGDSSLLNRIMEQFGIGNKADKVLIVTKPAVELLEDQGVHVKFEPCAEFGRVERVAVLSRLGKFYFLRHGKERFSLPKEMVVSWSTTSTP